MTDKYPECEKLVLKYSASNKYVHSEWLRVKKHNDDEVDEVLARMTGRKSKAELRREEWIQSQREKLVRQQAERTHNPMERTHNPINEERRGINRKEE